jgi:two-component system sensor histidine kinase EvgS
VLEKQIAMLGYAAEQAGEGEEALRRWREHDYSLILADCQMPGMDGFAFARALRAEEAARPARPRTPIVGWTANVMPEDIEACLAAGMDAVLAKPSALATVQSVLDTWVRAIPSPPPGVNIAGPVLDDGDAPIDHEQLRLIMNGDPSLEREMLDGFREAGPRAVEALLGALMSGGPDAVRADAHRLKGLAKLVAAPRLAEVCQRLEEAGRRGVILDAAADADEIRQEWTRLERYLDAVLA